MDGIGIQFAQGSMALPGGACLASFWFEFCHNPLPTFLFYPVGWKRLASSTITPAAHVLLLHGHEHDRPHGPLLPALRRASLFSFWPLHFGGQEPVLGCLRGAGASAHPRKDLLRPRYRPMPYSVKEHTVLETTKKSLIFFNLP